MADSKEEMNCRACDTPNRPGAQFCKRCSAPLPPTCQGCGAPVEPGVEICSLCRTERVPAAMGTDDVLASAEEATEVTAAPFDLRPRFTGRASALERLQKAFDDARELGELAFTLVIGEPGMGKSRLVRELARTLKATCAEARFLLGDAERRGVAYGSLAELLEHRFGIVAGEAAEPAQEKIIAGVAEVLPAAKVTEVAHLLAHLMRVPFAESPVVGPLAESPTQLETRTYIAVRRFLAADAARGPLVLCFENLELCGPETINLLHYLAAGLSSSPVVLLGTARVSLYDRHPSFGEGDVPLSRIDLEPLEPREAEALVRELCRPLGDVPERILAHAGKLGGSPRAAFELVRYLLESGAIAQADAEWQVDKKRLASMRLPASHEEILSERLRVMAPAERDLLEKAAAVGEVFWLDAVVALVRIAALKSDDPDGPTLGEIAAAGDHTRISVAQALAKLVEREWLVEERASSVPGEREYRFAYPPLWEAAYDGIDEMTRRRYHKLVAQWLELRPEGRGPLAQEDVGRHLELAGDVDGAAARYRRAADTARGSFLNERAIRLYAQALACIGEADLAARIHLWHDLGSVYELKGDFEAALGAFERMLRLAWVVASRTKAAVAFNKMGRVWRRKGDLKLALEYLDRGLDLFEQAGDGRGIAGSLDDIGTVLHMLGRYDEAYEKVTAGLSRRGKGGDDRSIARSLSSLGNIQKDRGRFAEAERCHTEALERRRPTGDRAGVVGSLNNIAVLAFELGDHAGARRGWEQALVEAEEIGALPLQALALGNLGELALIEGKHEEARSRLTDSRDLAEEIDDRRLLSEATRNLALLDHIAGQTAAAVQLAERALQIASSAGLRDYEGRALLALGEVHAGNLFDAEREEGGGVPPAADFFLRGVAVLRDIGNESELAKGLERFGRYKIERGDVDDGKALLREALAIFSKLGMKQGEQIERVLATV